MHLELNKGIIFMKKNLLCAASVLCLLTTNSFAMHSTKSHKSNWHAKGSGWFIGAGGGLNWSHLSKSTTTVSNGSGAASPMDHDTFTVGPLDRAGIEQLSVGYRWHQKKKFLPYSQVYLQYRHSDSVHTGGTVDQYTLPDFVNYVYSVSYESDLFTLNGKLDLVEFHHIMPYVTAGAGFIMTHLNGYTETAIPPVTARISPGYLGGTQTSLALTAGVGVDFILSKNFWLTLGYDHVFEGSAQSGSGQGSWSPTSLNLGSVHADAVFLNLSARLPDVLVFS